MKTKVIQCKIIYNPKTGTYFAKVKGWFFWHNFCIRSISAGPGGPPVNITEHFSSVEEAKTCIKNYYEEYYTKTIQIERPYKISVYGDGSVSVIEQ